MSPDDKIRIGKAIQTKTPFFTGKSQDGFLILGDLLNKDLIKDPHNMELELKINGELRQKDNTGNMYFKIN